MQKIKLENNGNYAYIKSPSGRRITAGAIEIGKTYLHQNNFFLRTVMEFSENNTHLYYSQFNRVGYCSKQHFAKLCPHEATEDEVKFLLSEE